MTRKQRENQNNDFNNVMECSKMSQFVSSPLMSFDEQKILANFPFFGGTQPEGDNTIVTTEKKTVAPAGGNTTEKTEDNEDDPIAKLQKDPNALKDLLSQVSKLTTDHQKTAGELTKLQTEKEKQERAQLSKEENLQRDHDAAIQQVEQLTEIVRKQAIENAFVANSGDVQWNSIKQALAELDDNNFSIEVNFDTHTVDASGLDKEVKRIAKDFPWLVKNGGGATTDPQPQPGRGPGRPRSTGVPPAPIKQTDAKNARRAEMMNRYPVLSVGR